MLGGAGDHPARSILNAEVPHKPFQHTVDVSLDILEIEALQPRLLIMAKHDRAPRVRHRPRGLLLALLSGLVPQSPGLSDALGYARGEEFHIRIGGGLCRIRLVSTCL